MELVRAEALEARLGELGAAAADPRAGLFGPHSTRWRIDREAALFLGAGRALLLQLAHPWVAAAVAEHSRALDDPIGRFHGTFGTVFAMVFGSTEDAFRAARRLHIRHETIRGTVDGAPYAANEVNALRWVFATLVDTALETYALVLPLDDEARARYYGESRRFAACFGLSAADLPPDWPAFQAYVAHMLAGETIAVGERARATAARLLEGAGSWIVIPPWYRALTASLLPDRLRRAFGLPLGAREERLAARALVRIRALYPRLPRRLRFVGPYFEACERLEGRAPGRATRISNRFWIGRPSLAAG